MPHSPDQKIKDSSLLPELPRWLIIAIFAAPVVGIVAIKALSQIEFVPGGELAFIGVWEGITLLIYFAMKQDSRQKNYNEDK